MSMLILIKSRVSNWVTVSQANSRLLNNLEIIFIFFLLWFHTSLTYFELVQYNEYLDSAVDTDGLVL